MSTPAPGEVTPSCVPPLGTPVPSNVTPSRVPCQRSPQRGDPRRVPCTAPVRWQPPASAAVPLYCRSMAIDFSSRVNLAGPRMCRVFLHVWLRLCRARSSPCWFPSPATHLPLASAAVKLKDIRKNSLVKRKLGFHQSAANDGLCCSVGSLQSLSSLPRAAPPAPPVVPAGDGAVAAGLGHLWEQGGPALPPAWGHSCCTGGSVWGTFSPPCSHPSDGAEPGDGAGGCCPLRVLLVPSVSFLSPCQGFTA